MRVSVVIIKTPQMTFVFISSQLCHLRFDVCFILFMQTNPHFLFSLDQNGLALVFFANSTIDLTLKHRYFALTLTTLVVFADISEHIGIFFVTFMVIGFAIVRHGFGLWCSCASHDVHASIWHIFA